MYREDLETFFFFKQADRVFFFLTFYFILEYS